MAETDGGGTGWVYIGLGGGESGRTRGKRARKIRPPLMAPARLGEEFPNESEGEREGKMGGKGEWIPGNISPHFIARVDGGRQRERREEGDDGWAPPVSEGGGRARLSAARSRGRPMGRGGEEREGGSWAEPAQ